MSVTSVLNVFGRSPIRPLQKHMEKSHECAAKLLPFFEAVMKQDWDAAKKLQQQIATEEGEADELKRHLRLHLPRGLFMAVSRSDVLDLITRQDQIANLARDISGLAVGRCMQLPKVIEKDFIKLLRRCIDASYQANKAIRELSQLFEVGFSGKEVKIVKEMVDTLHKIEQDTDVIQVKIRQALFKAEGELPPVDVVFIYKAIEWTGDLANRAQHIGDRLQMILAR